MHAKTEINMKTTRKERRHQKLLGNLQTVTESKVNRIKSFGP